MYGLAFSRLSSFMFHSVSRQLMIDDPWNNSEDSTFKLLSFSRVELHVFPWLVE